MRALYERRIEEPVLNAALFGAWCAHKYKPEVAIVPLRVFWDELLRGVVPANPSGRIFQIVQLVGIFHAQKETIEGTIQNFGGEPESTVAAAGEKQFALTRRALIFCERYVFACLWPYRLKQLTAQCVPSRPAPYPEVVRTWLIEVSLNMASSNVEFGCREIYCGAMLPVAVALRSTKDAYERYRDYDAEYPTGTFAKEIELVALNPPRDILAENLAAQNRVVEISAVLGIFQEFMKTVGVPIKVNSACHAGMEFCPTRSIYFTKDHTFMRVGEAIIQPAIMTAFDVVFGYVEHAIQALPGNVVLRDVHTRFTTPMLNDEIPEWAMM